MENIQHSCAIYDIQKYVINEDGTIDVFQDVDLSYLSLNKCPLMFNKVFGDFNISHNYLSSLYGTPKIVTGNFICICNKISSMEYHPLEVGGYLKLWRNDLSLDEIVEKMYYRKYDILKLYCDYDQNDILIFSLNYKLELLITDFNI